MSTLHHTYGIGSDKIIVKGGKSWVSVRRYQPFRSPFHSSTPDLSICSSMLPMNDQKLIPQITSTVSQTSPLSILKSLKMVSISHEDSDSDSLSIQLAQKARKEILESYQILLVDQRDESESETGSETETETEDDDEGEQESMSTNTSTNTSASMSKNIGDEKDNILCSTLPLDGTIFEEIRRALTRDGFVIIRGLIEPTKVALARYALLQDMSRHGQTAPPDEYLVLSQALEKKTEYTHMCPPGHDILYEIGKVWGSSRAQNPYCDANLLTAFNKSPQFFDTMLNSTPFHKANDERKVTHDTTQLVNHVIENEKVALLAKLLLTDSEGGGEEQNILTTQFKWIRGVGSGQNTGLHVDHTYVGGGDEHIMHQQNAQFSSSGGENNTCLEKRKHVNEGEQQGEYRVLTAWIPIGPVPIITGSLLFLPNPGQYQDNNDEQSVDKTFSLASFEKKAETRLFGFNDGKARTTGLPVLAEDDTVSGWFSNDIMKFESLLDLPLTNRTCDENEVSYQTGDDVFETKLPWQTMDFEPGDVAFFGPLTPHMTCTNVTDWYRLSCDTRWIIPLPSSTLPSSPLRGKKQRLESNIELKLPLSFPKLGVLRKIPLPSWEWK